MQWKKKTCYWDIITTSCREMVYYSGNLLAQNDCRSIEISLSLCSKLFLASWIILSLSSSIKAFDKLLLASHEVHQHVRQPKVLAQKRRCYVGWWCLSAKNAGAEATLLWRRMKSLSGGLLAVDARPHDCNSGEDIGKKQKRRIQAWNQNQWKKNLTIHVD